MAKKQGFTEPKTPFRRDKSISTRAEREAKKRQAVNVYVNRDIMKIAREMKINFSQVLERELDELTGDERAKRFYQENKTTIDAYNAYVEKHGTLAMQLLEPDAFDDPSV